MTDLTFAGNPLTTWTLAVLVAVTLIGAVGAIRGLLVRRLRRLVERTDNRFPGLAREIVRATSLLLTVPIAAYAGAQLLELPPRIDRIVTHVAVVALMLQAALWGNRAIVYLLAHNIGQRVSHDAAGATTLAIVGFISRLVLWSVVILLILGNVTGLVAGLGIGGIAVALAAQNILGDLFASLSIALDKPFLIGDFIIVGDKMGTVEYIGLKTTRLRSLGGEQIVFSNTDLLNNAIRNYKRMFERRVLFSIGVVYETDQKTLAMIPGMIREIIESQPKTRFDRAHFKEFGDFALVHEVVYYVLDPDYNVYMDIQHKINLALFQRFADAGIEFAYPTRRIYVSPPDGLPSRAST
jgi:small-conductance mechanosensitive channel